MTGGARLPYIGAQAVILGMAAFNSNAKAVDTQLQQLGRSAYYLERTSRGAFAGVSGAATSMFDIVQSGAMVTAGILTSLATAALVMGQRYTREVNNVGIISEATSTQIDQLSLAQLNLSRYSTESASSLNKASGELSKAGFAIADITGHALEAANNLVVLSEGELKAADAAVAMQVGTANFGVSVDEIERITNTATAAVLRSTLTFTGYADAMRQGGGVAASTGLQIEEFGAAVASAGLRIASGTEIGTGMRQMFLRLQNPTKASIEVMKQYGISLYDANGAARPFRDVIISLENAFGDQAIAAGKVTQAQRDQAVAALFGARAVKVVNALIDGGVETYDNMTDAIKRLDAASLASQFLAQTGAKFDMIGNSANALSIAFGKGLDPVVNALATSFLTWLRSFDLQKVEAMGAAVGDVLYNALSTTGELLATILPAYQRYADSLAVLYTALNKVVPVSKLVDLALKGISNEIVLLVSASAAGTDALANFNTQVAAAINGTSTLGQSISGSAQAFATQFTKGVDAVHNSLTRLAVRTGQSVKIVKGWFNDLADHLNRSFSIVMKALIDPWEKIWGALVRSTETGSKAVGDTASSVGTAIDGMVSSVGSGVDTVGGWLSSLGEMFDSLYNTVDGFGNDVFSVFNGLGEAVGGVVQWFADGFSQVGETLDAFGSGVIGIVGSVIEGFGVLDSAVGAFTTSIMQELSRTIGVFGDALDEMFNNVGKGLQWVMDQVAYAINTITRGWSNGWSAMSGVVGKAVNWILSKVNAMLDALISLPIVGEAIGIARAAMTQAEVAFTATANAVSGTITGLVKSTAQGIKSFEANTTSYFRNFAGQLRDINAKAKEARDKMLEDLKKKPHALSPEESTEPGSIPSGDGGADKALKKLQDLLDRADEIWQDFGKDLEKEQRTIAEAITKAYESAAQGMAKAFKKSQEAITEAQIDAYDKVNELANDQRIERYNEQRTKSFEDAIEAEERLRTQQFEDAEALHRIDLENDAAFEAEKRKDREDEFDKYLDGLARGRARDRQDEDRVFAASQRARDEALQKAQDQDEKRLDAEHDRRERELKAEQERLERALKLQQDAREETLQKEIDAQEAALKKTLAAEADALKKSQDLREEALKKQFDAEERARDAILDLADINREDAAARAEQQVEYTAAVAKAQAEYNAEIAKGVKASIAQTRLAEKLADINKDNTDKVAKINKDTTEKKTELSTKQSRAQADADFEASQEARLAALRATFDAEDAAAEVAAEARTLALKTETEGKLKALRAKFDEEELAQEAAFNTQTLELRKKLEEETTKLHNDQEKARRDLSDKMEYEALIRSREREDEDRKYAEDQTKRKNNFIEIENKNALALQRKIDEAERMRKRGLDDADFIHGKQIEQQKEDFRKKLDDEAYNRRVFQIGMESLERINTAKTTLSAEQELTREKLASDLVDLQDSLRDRIATIQANYLDKLQDVVKDGGAKLQPVVDEVTHNINEALWGIRDAARDATEALADTFDAARHLSQARVERITNSMPRTLDPDPPYGTTRGNYTYLGEGVWGFDNSTDAGSQADDDYYRALNGYAKGGTIPGPYGSPVPIIAHGGEQFEGLGGHATAMAAVRAAESMWAHGVGASVTNYDIDYNVEAHYGKEQPVGSVARDLSALAILTRN